MQRAVEIGRFDSLEGSRDNEPDGVASGLTESTGSSFEPFRGGMRTEVVVSTESQVLAALARSRCDEALGCAAVCVVDRCVLLALEGRSNDARELFLAIDQSELDVHGLHVLALLADALSLYSDAVELVRVRLSRVLNSDERSTRLELIRRLIRADMRDKAAQELPAVEEPSADPAWFADLCGCAERLSAVGWLQAHAAFLPAQVRARLALQAGRPEEVLAIAEQLPPIYIGHALILMGRCQEALALLEKLEPTGVSLALRAQALSACGRVWSAYRYAVQASRLDASLPVYAVRLAVVSRLPLPDWLWRLWVWGDDGFDPLRSGAFEAYVDDSELTNRRRAVRRAADKALRDLASHFHLPNPDPRFGKSSRLKAIEILRKLPMGADASVLLEEFRNLQVHYPWSPYPWTYGGELLLWMGESGKARKWFLHALRHPLTRWGYVGLALCDVLQGRPGRARLVSRLGVLLCRRLEESTVPGVEGEIERLLGRSRQAERLLRAACSQRPGRHGARANLAILLDEQGRSEEARVEWEALKRALPAVARDCGSIADSAGLFLQSLSGNRSSWLQSAVVDGEFRVFPSTTEMATFGREALRIARRRQRSP